ncbi:uncharacterized protein LOC142350694 [Convolutriloba macropyga]|uniref:uncharacterized protein LOC142350694 n=1 Tax=Convolutriloba macropyga TaxID=536237 RepID=UPI003F51F1B1
MAYDKDNSGFITADEIREVTKNGGSGFSEQEIEGMIKDMDKDGDGRINYEEFYKAMTGGE